MPRACWSARSMCTTCCGPECCERPSGPAAVNNLASFMPALSRVQMLVLDVDGVLTDGRLYYGARGEVLKAFNVKDGHGIKQVAAAGITVAIISGRKSSIVARRARELGIRHVNQGVADKLAALT